MEVIDARLGEEGAGYHNEESVADNANPNTLFCSSRKGVEF